MFDPCGISRHSYCLCPRHWINIQMKDGRGFMVSLGTSFPYLLVFVHVAAVYVRSVGRTGEHLYDPVEVILEFRERVECRHDAHALTLREVFRHDDVRDVLTERRHATKGRLQVLQSTT